jgi:hypothetical protein
VPYFPLRLDALDPNPIVALSMALGLLVAFTPFLLENDDLITPNRSNNLAVDLDTLEEGLADLDIVSLTHQHDLLEQQAITGLEIRRYSLDQQLVSGADPILLSTMLYNRILAHSAPHLTGPDVLTQGRVSVKIRDLKPVGCAATTPQRSLARFAPTPPALTHCT